MNGRIKKGKNTQGHGERLRELGYEVSEDDTHFTVECNGFIEGDDNIVDATSTESLLAAARKAKEAGKLFTYKTQFRFRNEDEDGNEVDTILKGLPVLSKLGELSAMVAKPTTGGGKSTGPKISEL